MYRLTGIRDVLTITKICSSNLTHVNNALIKEIQN